MPRRVPIEHLWNLEPDDPVAIANARIVQALWRCARALPGAYPENDFDTLGMLIAPIFDRLLTPLRAAVKTYVAAAAAKGRSPVSIEPHLKSLLHDRQAHTMLGEALTRGTLAFRSVFDKAEAKLTTFVAAHAHPSDQNIDTLSRMLSLAPPEISYLRLATAFCHGSIERRHFSFVDSGPRLIRAIETLCGVPGSKAMRIFDADRSLARSGLLEARASKRSRVDLDDMLQLSAVGE